MARMTESLTIEAALRAAAQRLSASETPQLDARVIARHVLGLDDAGLILEAKRALTPAETERLDAALARRAAGEPVAYIVGEKEFFGLTFRTAPGVLVPRPDTETLIEAALEARLASGVSRILDLGTGTGCLLLTLLSLFPEAEGTGVDINPQAVRLARENAAALGLGDRARFVAGDWAAPLEGRFDLVVSNPPYIRDGDRARLSPDIRDFEDARALFSGADGLDACRAIFAVAPGLAAPGALLVLEIGEGQRQAAESLAKAAFPAAAVSSCPDMAGRPRAVLVDLDRK